ncbi:MAG TPA: nucleotide-binding protein [Methanoregulaceae archaeon]|nr:nucleotide-binding protein [Methanoregulaceae archaeon]HQJ88280.1 nucleotide-binding protein [Methanoregulaceae archaeon]
MRAPGTCLVLDASAFFAGGERLLAGPAPAERLLVPPAVVEEVRDAAARCRLELALERGLLVLAPTPAALAAVTAAVVAAGETDRLSPADREALALAHEQGAALATDDFALQNAAERLGVPCRPIAQRAAAPRRRGYRCTGCGRFGDGPGECPVCGAEVGPLRRRTGGTGPRDRTIHK